MTLVSITRLLTVALSTVLLWFVYLCRGEPYFVLSPGFGYVLAFACLLSPAVTHRLPRGSSTEDGNRMEVYILRAVCLFVTALAITYFPFDISKGSMAKVFYVGLAYVAAFTLPYLLGFVARDESRQGSGWIGVCVLVCLTLPVVFGAWMYRPAPAHSAVPGERAAELGPVTGDTVTLSKDVFVTFTEEAWDSIGDKEVMVAKIRRGEAAVLPVGTTVKVSEVGFGWRSVVPIDGAFVGRTGRVQVGLLK